MNDDQVIYAHLVDYLKLKQIKLQKSGGIYSLVCPICKKEPATATIFLSSPSTIRCRNCKKPYNIVQIAQEIEPNYSEYTIDEIVYNLKNVLGLKVVTSKDEVEIDKIFDYYEKNNFDLVPIAKNSKAPIEQNWTNKEHKDKSEWSEWIRNGLNIGIKTGLRSNVTVIDIDTKQIPEEIEKYKGQCVIQETSKGYHLIYKYEEDLQTTRIDELKVDILNNGKQFVTYPSIVEDTKRIYHNLSDIQQMPKELKEYLLTKTNQPSVKTFSERLKEDLKTEDFKLSVIKEGEGRNDFLIRFAGLLRKDLNLTQVQTVISVVNRHFCNPPLAEKEIRAMLGSLDKYVEFDEQELAIRVLQYIKDAEDATRQDVERALGEKKARVDKVLTYLVKEGYLLRKGRYFHVIKKLEWKDDLINIGTPINFKMPYFYDIAHFNYGDLIVIGSKNKFGKTHISINMIKQLVEQGIKPYYISLETGSRFAKIALHLGLKEGDFHHAFCADPTRIELEKNAITIIDWLLIVDKAKTDLIFRHFIEQLDKQGGFLIIFQQLKQTGEYFAPNMAMQFPALSTRYLYENEKDGTYGKFAIDVVREPKTYGSKIFELPCKYDWQTKLLQRIDELKQQEEQSNIDVSYPTEIEPEVNNIDGVIDEQEPKEE